MLLRRLTAALVGTYVFLRSPLTRDQRGLSQSTENAVLLAGAVLVAGVVVTAISAYVKSRMP